jgi:hypothetical protein
MTIQNRILKKSLKHDKISIEDENYSQLKYHLQGWWKTMTSLFVISTVAVYSVVMKYVLDNVVKPH